MQRKIEASLEFIEKSPSVKITFGTGVTGNLTTNAAIFAALPFTVSALNTLNTNLSTAAAAAQSGDHTARAALVNAEKAWENAFRKTANYVSMVADNDGEIITKGGFVPTKAETEPTHPPEASAAIQVVAERGQGLISVSSAHDKAVKAYVVVAAPPEVSVVQDENILVITVGNTKVYVAADTHRKTTLHHLSSDVRVNVSIMPFNNAGAGPLSDAQSVTPQ